MVAASKIAFVSGVTGSGKTETIKSVAARFLHIQSDHLQYEAARRAFPFLKSSREFSWTLWPRDPTAIDMVTVLSLALQSVAPQLAGFRGHLVVEGAILSNDWFREPLMQALANAGHGFTDEDVLCLQLQPPADRILQQIHARAARANIRAREVQRYPDVAAVVRLLEAHWNFLNPAVWRQIADTPTLARELQAHFGVISVPSASTVHFAG